jgi:nickel superoxide dismutase
VAGKRGMVPFGRVLILRRLRMNTKINNKRIFISVIIVVLVLVVSSIVYSHCQIPCGIYDDAMRFNMMAEHIVTVEKSMTIINLINGKEKQDMNQLVRWIQNKEAHADELSHIITYYFMAQRIKPAEKTDSAEYDEYLNKLTLLHRMLISSMKAKQSTDLTVTKQLTELLAEFKKEYYEKSEHEHEH